MSYAKDTHFYSIFPSNTHKMALFVLKEGFPLYIHMYIYYDSNSYYYQHFWKGSNKTVGSTIFLLL